MTQENQSKRWLRPAIWAVLALLVGLAIWWTEGAQAALPLDGASTSENARWSGAS